MNNTFSIHRFGLLLKRQWLEFGKIYLISLAVLLGIFLLFYGFAYNRVINYTELHPGTYGYGTLNFRVPLFCISGLIFGSIIASSYFANLGQKSKAIVDLLTPASVFEKFLCGLFFTALVATISFLSLFYVTDLVFVMKIRDFIENATKAKLVESNNLDYFFIENNPNKFKPLYLVPFLLTSIFLLGSIYFEKFHYIKTAIIVMIFCGIWTAIVAKLGEVLFEGRIPVANNQMRHMFSERETAEYLGALLIVVLTLIFWKITYVRLKEKEV